jgi:ATP-binding cassette subfamily G (WHITE) protein 2 (SNQ2)
VSILYPVYKLIDANIPLRTTADFLTSLCDPTARQFQPGREASTPKTPQELEEAFRKSDSYQILLADVNAVETRMRETNCADTNRFKKSVEQCE